jgi:hypothetical protein
VPLDVDELESEEEGDDEEDNQPIKENMGTQTEVVKESSENA